MFILRKATRFSFQYDGTSSKGPRSSFNAPKILHSIFETHYRTLLLTEVQLL